MHRRRLTLLLVSLSLMLIAAGPLAAAPLRQSATNPWNDSEILSQLSSSGPPLSEDGQYPVVVVDGNGLVMSLWRASYTTTGPRLGMFYNIREDGVWQDLALVSPLPAEFDASSYSGTHHINAVRLNDGNILAVVLFKGATTTYGSSVWDKDSRTWSPYTVFVTDTSLAENAQFQLRATSTGAAMVVKKRTSPNAHILYYMYYTAASDSWSDPRMNSTMTDAKSTEFVNFAVSGDDSIFLTYPDNLGRLFAGRIRGNTADDRVLISDEVTSVYSDEDRENIIAFEDGTAMVVYANRLDSLIYYRWFDGTEWLPAQAMNGFGTPDGDPIIAKDGAGRIAIAVRVDLGSNNEVVQVITDSRPDQGGSFGATPLQLHAGADEVAYGEWVVRFTNLPDGSLVMAYGSQNTALAEEWISTRRLGADGWSEPTLIETSSVSGSNLYFIMFAVDADGYPTVTWTSKYLTENQQVYAANYYEPLYPSVFAQEPGEVPENEPAPVVPECLTMPDVAVVQQSPLSAGGSTTLEVTVRNQYDRVHGVSDVLLSLADGITVSDATAGAVNLGQRAALQGLMLQPNETRSFVVTVNAGETTAPAPIFVAEVYCGGRVLGSVSGPFGGPIAEITLPAVVPVVEPTVAEVTPTAPALPDSLPNTAGTLLPLGSLALLAAAALAVGRRLRG